MPHPGGCVIGKRPIDIHVDALRHLGTEIREEESNPCRDENNSRFLYAKNINFHGRTVMLRFPSVGATENIMMASVFCREKVKIINAAKEPEIIDLQNYLNACGAKISGAGTSTVEIEGVSNLKGSVKHRIIPDRIEAGTYLLAAAIQGEDVLVRNCESETLENLCKWLSKAGCEIETRFRALKVKRGRLQKTLKGVGTVFVEPYPGFPTDLQAPFCSLLALTKGESTVVESVFEDRFRHVDELNKMGTHLIKDGSSIHCHGVDRLNGADVVSSDLRCGAALILAGLTAEGITIVEDMHFVERGYADIITKLTNLGADVSVLPSRTRVEYSLCLSERLENI